MARKQVCVRDARVEFVIREDRGEPLSGLCREYGIARPTGYLWVRRYREQGVAVAVDRGDEFQVLAVRPAAMPGEQEIGEADDRVQRCAQIVGDAGEEFRADAVEFEQAIDAHFESLVAAHEGGGDHSGGG